MRSIVYISCFIIFTILGACACSTSEPHDWMNSDSLFGIMATTANDENGDVFFITDDSLKLIPDKQMQNSELKTKNIRVFIDYKPLSDIQNNEQIISINGIQKVSVKNVIKGKPDDFDNINEYPQTIVDYMWCTGHYLNIKENMIGDKDNHTDFRLYYEEMYDSTTNIINLYLKNYTEEQYSHTSVHFTSFNLNEILEKHSSVSKWNVCLPDGSQYEIRAVQ